MRDPNLFPSEHLFCIKATLFICGVRLVHEVYARKDEDFNSNLRRMKDVMNNNIKTLRSSIPVDIKLVQIVWTLKGGASGYHNITSQFV